MNLQGMPITNEGLRLMRGVFSRGLCGVLLLWLGSSPSWAHHYMGDYDMDHLVEVTGTVKQFQWTNPHSWLIVMVADDKGVAKEWAYEGPPPAQMRRLGMERTMLKEGDKVDLKVGLKKDGQLEGIMASIVMVNGQPGPGDFPLIKEGKSPGAAGSGH